MARKSGLGRGLGALLGDDVTRASQPGDSSALLELPLDQIQPNPDQPRRSFDDEGLAELADSVRQNGILQPIVVRRTRDGYQIIAGERRYRAAHMAGLTTVPVVVRKVSDDEVLQLALVENLQRDDLNAIEAAMGYRTLMEQNGLTQEELGTLVSKSRSAIANALRLLELPDEVLDLVREGTLSAGHARAILRVSGDEARVALAHKVVDEGLSVRQTEILGPLFSVKTEKRTKRRQETPPSFGDAAKRLRDGLSTKVSVRTVRGRNKIEIEFGDEEELEALVRRIVGDDEHA